MTRTPAFIDLRGLNLTVSGTTATEQAYNVLQHQVMAGFYGDTDPRRHLKDARRFRTWADARASGSPSTTPATRSRADG
jgi:hypothetical protein